MKRVALVFVTAVLVPSLVLAWLAVRSLRDQQFLLERQQALLYQSVTDGLARNITEALTEHQRSFAAKVSALVREHGAIETAQAFDQRLPKEWPLAQIGFVVTLTGDIISPLAASGAEARKFLGDNSRFLANREAAEVYLNPKQMMMNSALANTQSPLLNQQAELNPGSQSRNFLPRNVIPQQQVIAPQAGTLPDAPQQQQFSRVAVSEAEFRQLIGEDTEGMLARFVDNRLTLLFWCRPELPAESPPGKITKASLKGNLGNLVFGAELSLPRLVRDLRRFLDQLQPPMQQEICLALLDDMGKPAALSHAGFQANWKRPLVATEIGEALPHWEAAVYLLDPARLTQSARALKLTLGLLIAVLVLAIGIGSWLIVADLNRQLTLARQKTDFVSNVSHELKTPLTSIRMFSELLADGRITDPAKQRSYLCIITSEAARLTRLINNVLDFARMERGEKKHNFQQCDAAALVRETAESFRPHLEAAGFQLQCEIPPDPLPVKADRDALAQVLVNLLSNAEKYSDARKEVEVKVREYGTPLPYLEIAVSDRGMGVPRGSEQKIFEKFYRAHDSLSSGIQGSGLGLTLARQIARAHGGDLVYERRDGGGSCFILRLPLLTLTPVGERRTGSTIP